MDNILKYLSLFLPITFANCTSDNCDKNREMRENYLIEKISKFETATNFSNTIFTYDQNNKLLTKITTGKFIQNNQLRNMEYRDEFEYTNGLVSKIQIKDLTHFMFSYEIRVFYNSTNQIIRQEKWKNNVLIEHQKFYYSNNKVISIYDDDSVPFQKNRIYYDDFGNITKQTLIIPKPGDLIGTPIPGEFIEQNMIFEYDSKLKPNIGLDYLFIYTPLQGVGTETGFVRELSNNNLTKYNNSGTTWTFDYNELGLPNSYEMKWGGIQTLYPMIWDITYKKIK